MRGKAATMATVLALAAAVAFSALACDRGRDGGGGARSGTTIHRAHGTIEDVDAETRQALIDHDEVPGLMGPMTMSFDVVDEALLARMEAGQIVDFDIAFDGRSYRVVAVEVVGEVDPQDGWGRLHGKLVRSAPAPPFTLTDHRGELLSLSDLAGKALLLDFIFTECTGPCPILTSSHVVVQRGLPADVLDRVHFVSISLDPVTDRPEVLAEYGRVRGADLSHWSFLTGPEATVAEVVKSYNVGSVRAEDGTIEHMVITLLVNPEGQMVKRYFGHEHDPSELVADLVDLAQSSNQRRGS